MTFNFRRVRQYLPATVLLFVLGACGQSTGCSGCEQEGEPFPDKDKVHAAVQVRLSDRGISFLEDNLEPLLGQVLPEDGLNICLPGAGGDIIGLVQWGYCQADMCDGGPGCQLNISIGGIDLAAVEPDRLRATVTFDALAARLDIAANPIVDCSIAIDAPGFPVQVDLQLSTPDPTRDLTFSLADPVYRLADLNIRLQGNQGFLSFLCDAIDLVINIPFIGDLLLDFIQGFVDGVLVDLIQGFVEDFTCRTCEDINDCPAEGGAQCIDGRCTIGDTCLPAPLGIEGTLDVGALLAGFTPGLEASVDYIATPGSYVDVENSGLSVGIIAGALSERNRCVPNRPQPPTDIEPDVSPVLRGNVAPSGRPFELGLGITQFILDHFMWAAFNSGSLCLAITSEQVNQLNAMTLGIALPGLRRLTRGSGPIAITLAPQEVPIVTIGANTVVPDPDNEGQYMLEDPLLTIELPSLWLDFHAFMEDRWVRIFSLKADIVIPLGITFTPDNGLVPVLGDLTSALQNIETANGEIMVDDPARLEMLLPVLIGPLISLAADGLTDPIQLPDIIGYRLNLQAGDVTGIDENTLLGLFANLERDPNINDGMGAAFSVETDARVLDVHIPETAEFEVTSHDTWKKPSVRLALEAWDGTVEDAEMEYSWRVDRMSWSLFTDASEIVVRSPALLLQGRHQIEVRARRKDNYHTLDPTPASVEVIIDSIAPVLTLRAASDVVLIDVEDLISPVEAITLRARADDGEWQVLKVPEVVIDDAKTIEVEAIDEAGNVYTASLETGTVEAELIGRPDPNAIDDGSGCDCGCRATDSGGSSWLLALLLLWPTRRRRWGRFVVLGVAFVLSGVLGCDDNTGGSGEGDPEDGGGPRRPPPICLDDSDCPPNLQCLKAEDGSAACVMVTCEDDPEICQGVSCDTGDPAICTDEGLCECEPFCADGCGDGEYCCMLRNACESPPAPCEGDDAECPPGTELIVASTGDPDPMTCELRGAMCECAELEPLDPGFIGRYSDLAVVDGTAWISAYAEEYGDLVIGKSDEVRGIVWQWVDGVPEEDPTAGPSGPRGGISGEGPDVGQYTSIAAGPGGQLHVTYYDVDNRSLKYALGTPAAGRHTWQIQTLDDTGDAGRWNSLSVDARGVPGVAYRIGSVPSGEGFASEVRYRLAKNTDPGDAAGWNPPFTLQERMIPNEDPETGFYPEGTGLFTTQIRTPGGSPIVAWYDRTGGAMWWSEFVDAGFSEPEMLAGWGHPERDGDMGTNVDLTRDDAGNHHFCYQDGLTDSLRYLSPELGLDEWIDDGVRVGSGGREHSLHVVGEDCNIMVGADGQPIVVYQDATAQDLLMLRRDAEGNWTRRVLKGDEGTYRGAFGFYAAARLVDGMVWISNYVYNNQAETPTQFLDLFQEAL